MRIPSRKAENSCEVYNYLIYSLVYWITVYSCAVVHILVQPGEC